MFRQKSGVANPVKSLNIVGNIDIISPGYRRKGIDAMQTFQEVEDQLQTRLANCEIIADLKLSYKELSKLSSGIKKKIKGWPTYSYFECSDCKHISPETRITTLEGESGPVASLCPAAE